MSKINISNHPLILSKLTQLRLHDLPPKDFREGIRIIGSMLIYEAARDLPLRDVPDLRSPIAPFTGQTIPLRIGLSPILRAGIGLTDAALESFPEATVLHLGLFRDKVSLQAIEYYSKLPSQVTADLVFLLDRMFLLLWQIIGVRRLTRMRHSLDCHWRDCHCCLEHAHRVGSGPIADQDRFSPRLKIGSKECAR